MDPAAALREGDAEAADLRRRGLDAMPAAEEVVWASWVASPVVTQSLPAAPASGEARVRQGSPWSPERLAMGRTMWEAGKLRVTIVDALNLLPGLPISVSALKNRATIGQWRRPDDYRQTSAVNARHSEGAIVWTARRDATLSNVWPTGMHAEMALVRLNALPGPPVASAMAVKSRAKALRLQRMPEAARQNRIGGIRRRAGVAPAAEVAPALPPAERIVVGPSVTTQRDDRYDGPHGAAPDEPPPEPCPPAAVPARAAVPAVVTPVPRPPIVNPARYDWVSEFEDGDRVLCDEPRVIAYAARFGLRWNGDMLLINKHRILNGRKRMSLCEPALLPPQAVYPGFAG